MTNQEASEAQKQTESSNEEPKSAAEKAEERASKLYPDQNKDGEDKEAKPGEDKEDDVDEAKEDNEESDDQDEDNSEEDSEDSEDSEDNEDEDGDEEASYEFEAPEGVEINEELSSEFKDIAKEYEISEEAAKKLWDLGMKNVQELDFGKQVSDVIEKNRKEWLEAVQKDEELGGDNLEKTKQNIGRVMAEYGSEGLKELLDSSGLGNHPEIIRFVNKIGQNMSEGSFVKNNTGTKSDQKSRAERLYPNQN